jgi:hypothetical protein
MQLGSRSHVVAFRAVRRALVWLVPLACAGYVWGCFDVGSLSNGPAAGSDGGVDSAAPPSSGSDSGADSSSVAPGTDASTDGSTLPFCANQSGLTFCDDFDEEDAGAFANWDQIIANTQGSVTLDSTLSTSPPNSMSAQMGALVGGSSSEADLLKSFQEFQGKGITIVMQFDMDVQAWDSSTMGQIIAAEIIFKNSTNQYNQIVFNLNSIGTGVTGQIAENAVLGDGGQPYYNYVFSQHPATKKWTHVEIDMSIPSYSSSSFNTVAAKLDGQTVLDTTPLQIGIQDGTPVAHLGIGYIVSATSPWVVNYDNFTLKIANPT